MPHERPGNQYTGNQYNGSHYRSAPRSPLPGHRGRKRHGLRRGMAPSAHQAMVRRGASAAEVRRTRRRVLAALYVFLAIECVVAALTSPALAIREVRVNGIAALPGPESEAVLRVVRIAPGSNWLRTRSAPVASRLTAMPWVARAAVEKRFPDRIYVHVTAREPVAVLQAGGRLVEVDAGAVPIRSARPEMAHTLPRVVIPADTDVVFGALIQDDGVRAALRVLHETAGDITVHIAKIEVDQSDNLCLNMGDNTPIRLGQTEDLDAKLDQVRRICRSQPELAKSFTEIDLTCPARPACTPRPALTPTVAVSGTAHAAGLTP
jgi:cell division protein FtsQ